MLGVNVDFLSHKLRFRSAVYQKGVCDALFAPTIVLSEATEE